MFLLGALIWFCEEYEKYLERERIRCKKDYLKWQYEQRRKVLMLKGSGSKKR